MFSCPSLVARGAATLNLITTGDTVEDPTLQMSDVIITVRGRGHTQRLHTTESNILFYTYVLHEGLHSSSSQPATKTRCK